MAPPPATLKTSFDPQKVIAPFYTGGPVALDQYATILVTPFTDKGSFGLYVKDMETGETLDEGAIDSDGEVKSLAMTADASHLIVCTETYLMRIYALSPDFTTSPPTITPVLQRSVKAHNAPVLVAAVDPTGTLVATGASDGSIKVWDIRGGYATHALHGHGGVISALKFYAPQDGVYVPEARNEEEKHRKKKGKKAHVPKPGTSFMLASGSDDTTVRVWDLLSSSCVAVLEGHNSEVRALDWTKTGMALVSAGRDRAVHLWSAKDWSRMLSIETYEVLEAAGFLEPNTLQLESGEETPQVLFTSGAWGKVRLWDLRNATEYTANDADAPAEGEERERGIVQVLYQRGQNHFVTVQSDQSIFVHSMTLSTGVTTLPITRRISGTHDEIYALSYVTPSESLLALVTNSEEVRLLHSSAKSFGDAGVLSGHSEIVLCIDRDWSGTWLATGSKDNDARLWQIGPEDTGYAVTATATLAGHAESVAAIALPRTTPQEDSAARKELAPPKFIITGSEDRTIKKWEPSSTSGKWRATYTRRAHEKDINAIDLSPDDTIFASASQDRTVKVCNVEDGETIGVLRGHRRGVWSVKFAPQGVNASIVGGAEGQKGGKIVVTGSGDKTVRLWSLADYSCLKTFEGHTNSVTAAVWLSGGLQVASGAGDGLVKVWDVKAGECTTTLDGHEGKIYALATSADDSTIVSGGDDAIVNFWVDTTEAKKAEKAEAEKQLVEQEQQLENYIRVADYRKAITLALTLNHPGRLLGILTSVTATSPPEEGSTSGLLAVDEVLCNLSDHQLFVLLCRVRDWNTNAKTATVAQMVLWTILRGYGPEKLAGLKGVGKNSPVGVWDAIRSYTERHLRRWEEMYDESALLEYTLREMEDGVV